MVTNLLLLLACCTTREVHFKRATATAPVANSSSSPSSKPHIVMILVDDWGWANWGLHAQEEMNKNANSKKPMQATLEAWTPHLDELARSGIILDRHYAYSICSPSRCSLQSGRLAVHVNTQNTGAYARNASDPVSGYQGVPRCKGNMSTIPKKMKQAGYRTAATGKWDVGMATPQQMPFGRGYDEFYGYLQHANDYWNKGSGIFTQGTVDICLNEFTDFWKANATYRGGVLNKEQLSDSCRDSEKKNPPCYEEYLFTQQGLRIIENHDPSVPLFYFHSSHLIHSPLEVPLYYIHQAEDRLAEYGYAYDQSSRLNYSAMVNYLDDQVHQLTDALKKKDMWEDTLLVLVSDNGGPIYKPGGGNNFPLRGGKYSDFEGGIRTNGFMAGGYLQKHARFPGSHYTGVISIADWYGMFCELAGVNPFDFEAEEANIYLAENDLPLLPAVDSVSGLFAAIVSGDDQNLRQTLHVSPKSVIEWPYKLVTEVQPNTGWTGPIYPNCSTEEYYIGQPAFVDFKVFGVVMNVSNSPAVNSELLWDVDCMSGCLYDISSDPTEHKDLSGEPSMGPRLKAMQLELERLNEANFNPGRGAGDVMGCFNSLDKGGYSGPFVDSQNYYTGPFRDDFLGGRGSEEYNQYLTSLFIANIPIVNEWVPRVVQEIWPTLWPILGAQLDPCLVPPAGYHRAQNSTNTTFRGLVDSIIKRAAHNASLVKTGTVVGP